MQAQTQKLPPQFYFLSHREQVIGGTTGHSIGFEKGVPTHVPRQMHATVMEKGCLPCDKDGKILDDVAASAPGAVEEKKVLVEPEDADERNERIVAAMKDIVKRNNAKDFSAGSVPLAEALTSALGWRVDQKEVRPLWNKLKQEMAG